MTRGEAECPQNGRFPAKAFLKIQAPEWLAVGKAEAGDPPDRSDGKDLSALDRRRRSGALAPIQVPVGRPIAVGPQEGAVFPVQAHHPFLLRRPNTVHGQHPIADNHHARKSPADPGAPDFLDPALVEPPRQLH